MPYHHETPSNIQDFPAPDPEALKNSLALQALIKKEIEQAGGQIPFSRYMAQALYHPQWGYYGAGICRFGAQGDFVTAPESTPLFSQCIANQCQQILEQSEKSAAILEFGAGSGTMAAEILKRLETEDCLPRQYHILELSAVMAQRQRQTLSREVPHLLARINWLTHLPSPGFYGIVLANEVLDAMPVTRFRLGDKTIEEGFVIYQEDRLSLRFATPTDPGLAPTLQALGVKAEALPSGYYSECNLNLGPWLQSLWEVVDSGVLLLIDYGYPRSLFYHPSRREGTLLCHYRHRAHADPFLFPGLQDITAQVDFTAVAELATAQGWQLAGYTTQANFLMSCGLLEALQASDPTNPALHVPLVRAVERLCSPAEMGERFKVMALSKTWDLSLLGFSGRDMRYSL